MQEKKRKFDERLGCLFVNRITQVWARLKARRVVVGAAALRDCAQCLRWW
jgi:hypothetical protein